MSGGEGVLNRVGVRNVPTPAGDPADKTGDGVRLVPAPGGVDPFPVSMVLGKGASLAVFYSVVVFVEGMDLGRAFLLG